jgi:hypothetical protein
MEHKRVPDQIVVSAGRAKSEAVAIDGGIYTSLFENSYVHRMAPYQHSLESGQITFRELRSLARQAEIPYVFFFAPRAFVDQQLKRKSDLLLAGTGKDTFSLNTRGSVAVRDIELIIKDLLRKQTLPKKTLREPENHIVGMLKGSRLAVPEQAAQVRDALKIDLDHIAKLPKKVTFDYLVDLLGKRNIFVAQSAVAHMPQTIQDHVRFSGICIRDKTYPFIFLNNKDEEKSFEPEGRKVLTLVLLLVCITKAKFAPVTYSDQAKDLIHTREYEIAEEILMPQADLAAVSLDSLAALRDYADRYSVTPSACLMRLRRLNRLSADEAEQYFQLLKDEFASRKPSRGGHAAETTAFLKYNSPAYTAKVFELLDRGAIGKSDARRVLLQNRQKVEFLDELRNKL